MSSAVKRLQFLLLILIVITGIGITGFMALEKLSFFDALYFNIVTMATVGYGDIYPTSQASRLLALFIIIMGGGTFIAVIANGTGLFLQRREESQRFRKVNMILGVFYSEIGYHLMSIFAAADPAISKKGSALMIDMSWDTKQFQDALKLLKLHPFEIDHRRIDLAALRAFLLENRKQLVELLENPVLIEHDLFSEALLAVFHLADELKSRESFPGLPPSDLEHIALDSKRAYAMIVRQWFSYLEHLKEQYPYLYSLAIRKNPFNPKVSVIVQE